MSKLSKAVFPGSFDPLTFGHTDIIRRALKIFDKVLIGVLDNPDKTTLFTVNERISLIREEFADCRTTVEVESFSGLLVEYVKRCDTNIVIRGLRATSDYDYEAQMALANKNLSPEVETFFLMTSESCSYISSSLVRQIAKFGGPVSSLVPKSVEKAIKLKFV